MLLRLSATNYLSIFQRQEISLVATKLKGPEGNALFSASSDISVLPSAVIYGANASGKTNFVKAIQFLRNAVLYSHTRGNPEGGVPFTPFALNPASKDIPTTIEADFVIDTIRYQFGFEANVNEFTSEWLYSFPEGKRRKLYERVGDKIEFGSSLKGPKKLLAELMRPNSLFLSTATQNDHEDLSKIAKYFRSISYSSNISVAEQMLNSTFKKNEIDSRTIDFLKNLGTGVTGYRKNEVHTPELNKAMMKDFIEIVKKHMGESAQDDPETSGNEKNISIELAHSGADGKECFFTLQRESSGTRRLLLIMNAVFKAIDRGSVVIIDELDASLHTFASEAIIGLFSNPDINKTGAQLIATIHDTNILESDYLRRDQIWFCEKDEEGASRLFSLSDIKSRASDNFEQGYLEGRYGAIPPSLSVSTTVVTED